jgi:hypothetical protein
MVSLLKQEYAYQVKRIINTGALGKTYFKSNDAMVTFAIRNSTESLINMIDNTASEDVKRKLIQSVFGNATSSALSSINRKDSRVLNMIDLNIIPINLHSLMREIPLINIYNYSNTFDTIIRQRVGDYVSDPRNFSSVAVLASQLIEPHRYQTDDISGVSYNTLKEAMSDEIKHLNLYKPRFLSDQIWNKVLFHDGQTSLSGAELNRYNTKIVRNLIFMTNIQRIMRSQIQDSLDNINTRIVSNAKILSEQITEFNDKHSTYDNDEFKIKI